MNQRVLCVVLLSHVSNASSDVHMVCILHVFCINAYTHEDVIIVRTLLDQRVPASGSRLDSFFHLLQSFLTVDVFINFVKHNKSCEL